MVINKKREKVDTRREPSPLSLAAHIQLPDTLMSVMSEISAETRLVSDSPTAMRPIACGLHYRCGCQREREGKRREDEHMCMCMQERMKRNYDSFDGLLADAGCNLKIVS